MNIESREATDARSHGLAHAALIGEAFEASDHAVFVSDERHRIYLAVNDAACRLLGYERRELLTLTAQDVSARTPSELDAIYETVRKRGSVWETANLRRADGAVISIGYLGGRTSLDGAGQLVAITEPIQRAEVIERAGAAQERAVALREDAAAVRAHARHQVRRAEAASTARLNLIRASLRRREEVALRRLSDAVSELVAVHGLPDEEIFGHVMRAVAEERTKRRPDPA